MMTLFLLFTACSTRPVLYVTMTEETPIEVDTIEDDTDGDGDVEGYVAEEILVDLAAGVHGSPDTSLMPYILVDNYKIEYELTETSGDVPSYDSSFTVQIPAGAVVSAPIRAVSFTQKTWAGVEFGGSPVNAKAHLTLSGTYQYGQELSAEAWFDVIFANFVEPTDDQDGGGGDTGGNTGGDTGGTSGDTGI